MSNSVTVEQISHKMNQSISKETKALNQSINSSGLSQQEHLKLINY